jgi:hypothetical protein
MSHEARDNFERQFENRDHLEALEINQHFDSLYDVDHPVKDILNQAVEISDGVMADKVPHGDEWGYENVKRAFRWWNYRTALEHDDAPNLSQDLVIELGEARNAIGDQLLAGDPLIVAWYAMADNVRFNEDRRGNAADNTVKIENRAAVELFLNCLDTALDGPFGQAVSDDYRTFYRPVETAEGTLVIWANRTATDDGQVYALDVYSNQSPESARHDEPMARFMIYEGIEGISYEGIDDEEQPVEALETYIALKLSRALIADRQFNTSRRPTPYDNL